MSLGSIIGGGLGFLGGSLLGGGGGGGRTTGQGIQPTPTLDPQQQALMNRLIGFVQPQVGQVGRVPPSAMGPVGPSALQQQAFGFAGGLPQTLQTEAFGAFDPSQITQAMAPVGEYAQRMFQQETIPAIMGGLGYQGAARASGAADILGRAGRDVSLGLSAQFAPMQFGAQQAQLGRQAALPGIAGQMGGQMANIGAVQRGIPGEQQAFELQRFGMQDPLRNPAISLALQSLGIPTQENIAFQGYRQPSPWESFLPAAGQMLGGAFAGGYF